VISSTGGGAEFLSPQLLEEHALHLGDSKLASAVTSEKVSAWENAPVEAWENVSAAAAAIAAASKSVSEIVSRPGEPCSITSTSTGTRFSAYAALDDDVSARVVSISTRVG